VAPGDTGSPDHRRRDDGNASMESTATSGLREVSRLFLNSDAVTDAMVARERGAVGALAGATHAADSDGELDDDDARADVQLERRSVAAARSLRETGFEAEDVGAATRVPSLRDRYAGNDGVRVRAERHRYTLTVSLHVAPAMAGGMDGLTVHVLHDAVAGGASTGAAAVQTPLPAAAAPSFDGLSVTTAASPTTTQTSRSGSITARAA